MPSLIDDIRSHAKRIALPWGDEGDVISLKDVDTLAGRHGVSGCSVEVEALKQKIYPLRYLRSQQSISAEHQLRLLQSTVAQVGFGGLGGSLLEIFLRTGVGTIRGADGDHFEESNLNRQSLSKPSNLGLPKFQAAINRAQELNSSVHIEAHNAFLSPDTLPDFLAGCDVAVDALGGLKTRLHLQQAAATAEIPLVTGALAGWTGYVGVVRPGETGPADIMGHDNAAEETLGCPAPAVTFFASLMAAEAVRILTDSDSPLMGKMLVVDLQSLTFETVAIA